MTCLVKDCDRPVEIKARGMCRKHYLRWWKHGDPNIVKPHSPLAGKKGARYTHPPLKNPPTPIESPCREWHGRRNAKGYAMISRGRRTFRLHRWIWEQVNGPVPEGNILMHRCDNPPCFRYDHLILGTNAQNTADMMAKQRNRNRRT